MSCSQSVAIDEVVPASFRWSVIHPYSYSKVGFCWYLIESLYTFLQPFKVFKLMYNNEKHMKTNERI